MPTEAKVQAVSELVDKLSRASIAISTDFSGLTVNEITALRRHLREAGVEYKVVKNRIASIAAEQAGLDSFKEILEGASGIVLGYGEPVAAAKAVDEYIKESRAEMKIRKDIRITSNSIGCSSWQRPIDCQAFRSNECTYFGLGECIKRTYSSLSYCFTAQGRAAKC